LKIEHLKTTTTEHLRNSITNDEEAAEKVTQNSPSYV